MAKSSSNFNLFEVEEFKDSETDENVEESETLVKGDSQDNSGLDNKPLVDLVAESQVESRNIENLEETEFKVKANKKEEKKEKKAEAPREKSYIALMGEMEPGKLKSSDSESSEEDEKMTEKPQKTKKSKKK